MDTIVKLARKGATPSQIGVTLRDSHGIPQVKGVTGSKILRILKKNGMAPALPFFWCLAYLSQRRLTSSLSAVIRFGTNVHGDALPLVAKSVEWFFCG